MAGCSSGCCSGSESRREMVVGIAVASDSSADDLGVGGEAQETAEMDGCCEEGTGDRDGDETTGDQEAAGEVGGGCLEKGKDEAVSAPRKAEKSGCCGDDKKTPCSNTGVLVDSVSKETAAKGKEVDIGRCGRDSNRVDHQKRPTDQDEDAATGACCVGEKNPTPVAVSCCSKKPNIHTLAAPEMALTAGLTTKDGCCGKESGTTNARAETSGGCCSGEKANPCDEGTTSEPKDATCPVTSSADSCCQAPAPTPTQAVVTGCCSGTKSTSCGSGPKRVMAMAKPPTSPAACKDSCCGAPKPDPPAPRGCCSGKTSTCCDKKPATLTASGSTPSTRPASCADSCCGDPAVENSSKSPAEIKAVEVSEGSDLEKGLGTWEHAVISIQGMTCTGCETKLQRTLATVRGLSEVRTSLVLSRAEFKFDLGSTTAEEVMIHLKRTTGFECRRIDEKGHTIEILADGGDDILLREKLPEGVLGVNRGEKDTICISYDANVVGARDLVGERFGRPLKLAPMRMDPSIAAGSKHVRHVGWMTVLSALLTIPVLVLAWAPLPASRPRELIYSSISLALATIIQVLIAGPFYPAALKSLIFARVVEMDLLIVLSTSAAYLFSVIAFAFMVQERPLSTGEFFETSTLLVTLIMLGRFVGALARQKAVESISIRSLQQSTAVLVGANGTTTEIDARLLQYGDFFKVQPECRVATDGVVMEGISELDESMITGESVPVEKKPGDALIAGSVNGSGTLTVRTTRLPGANTIATIANMVDEAKLSKPRIQDLADRIAGYFVPVVAVLASITFIIWIAVGIAVRKQSGSEAAVNATTYAIAVLIVSCPCAIGLAVPMVVVIAGGVAADRGVIFKTAETIETARKAAHVVFDKTGTLTEGKLAVVKEEYFGDGADRVKSIILGLLSGIKHPVSVAVASHLREQGVQEILPSSVKSLPAKGVEGIVERLSVKTGNARWLSLESHPSVQALNSTVFCVTIDGETRAIFGLEDTIRSEALSVVQSLQAKNVAVSLLSGDGRAPVESVANRLGIPTANVRSRCTPSSKAEYIKSLLTTSTPPPRSKRSSPYASPTGPTVIFIGDGTNDAPALASASIGIHMSHSSGADLARSAADAVLVRPDLRGVLVLQEVSEAAFRRIAFNFAWAFTYNLFAVLLAGGAFVKARIPPAYAGLGEIVSVLPVVAVAVGMRWARFGGK